VDVHQRLASVPASGARSRRRQAAAPPQQQTDTSPESDEYDDRFGHLISSRYCHVRRASADVLREIGSHPAQVRLQFGRCAETWFAR